MLLGQAEYLQRQKISAYSDDTGERSGLGTSVIPGDNPQQQLGRGVEDVAVSTKVVPLEM